MHSGRVEEVAIWSHFGHLPGRRDETNLVDERRQTAVLSEAPWVAVATAPAMVWPVMVGSTGSANPRSSREIPAGRYVPRPPPSQSRR